MLGFFSSYRLFTNLFFFIRESNLFELLRYFLNWSNDVFWCFLKSADFFLSNNRFILLHLSRFLFNVFSSLNRLL